MSDTTVKLTGFTITNDGASYGINGQLESITLTAEQAQRAGERIMSLERQVAALESQLAESQRREELLRALYERHKHLDMFLSDEKLPPIGRTGSAILYELWEFIKQAALDGGAMGEG